MAQIHRIDAFQTLDSRGNPTITCRVILNDGLEGWASAPSGASRGAREALELRDEQTPFFGKSVLKAIHNIQNVIQPELLGKEISRQEEIDRLLSELGGEQKKMLGGNATLSVSIACCAAAAASEKLPLFQYLLRFFPESSPAFPIPIFNLINGGAHGAGSLNIQEFWMVPTRVRGVSEQIRAGAEIYHALKFLIHSKNLFCGVGDEGGFVLPSGHSEFALQLITESCVNAGYVPNQSIHLGLDVAASRLWYPERYQLDERMLSSDELIHLYTQWADRFALRFLEDGMAEQDEAGWKSLTRALSDRMLLIGDDLLVTQVSLLQWAKQQEIANAMVIKPNQVGTVMETIACIREAKHLGYPIIVSHRSGETEDTFIVDLAVASGAEYLKCGAPARTDRTAKYNRLLCLYHLYPDIPAQCD